MIVAAGFINKVEFRIIQEHFGGDLFVVIFRQYQWVRIAGTFPSLKQALAHLNKIDLRELAA